MSNDEDRNGATVYPGPRAHGSERLQGREEPTEKLLRCGPRALSAGELVTVLLGGSASGELEETAKRLVRRRGVRGLPGLTLRELRRWPFTSQEQATRLTAALELGRRIYRPEPQGDRVRITKPQDAFEAVRAIASAKKEHLVGLYLDAQNGLLLQETISIGTLNTTRTHPREILYPAISCLALGFILAHNHPSGCLDPSEEDVEFTQAVRRAGELMGIELYDHVIVAEGGYTSLRERGIF